MTITKPRAFWRGNELPIADFLREQRAGLLNDFMAGAATLEQAIERNKTVQTQSALVDGRPYDQANQITKSKNKDSEDYSPNVNGWLLGPVKYERHDDVMDIRMCMSEEQNARWPTAYNLIKKFGDDCQCSTYSILAPHTKIDRHTGPENRSGEFIRIHIPLIVPDGDIFLECLDEEITWDDVWGFNNQLTHSAHNNTDEYRLVFILDLRRTAIGLDPGVPYDPAFGTEVIGPFVRKK